MAQQQQQLQLQLQQQQPDDWEHRLRRYLLLLASLAATVTYAAGLDPPGGFWGQSDNEKMAVAGDPILRATNHRLYLVFYYSNATSFAASLVIILLLLVLPDKRPLDTIHLGALRLNLQSIHLRVLRIVMVLDLLALMVAYTAGSCREKVATFYTGALVVALSAYVGYHILEGPLRQRSRAESPRLSLEAVTEHEQLCKVLMLLSIFAVTITYDAGLKPPGGFWEHTTNGGLHRPGEVILKHKHGGRFAVFFFSNTAAFIASLFTVVLLLDNRLTASATRRLKVLYGFVLVTLVTLVVAYAAGSCRKTGTTAYTVALVAAVLLSIFLAVLASAIGKRFILSTNGDETENKLKEKRSLVLLLGTLAASITYQAGLNPPGGVWLENQQSSSFSERHIAGDPILLSTDDKRYSIFFYCNSTAFVASVVVILMVQIKALLKLNALRAAMIFDLFGLMGAYIAGSSRTLRASVHVIILAAAFLVYVTVIYFSPTTAAPSSQTPHAESSLKKRRKRLLLFAILVAAITYQAGLSPPGGFWRVDQGHSSAGSPILEVMYPRRYQAFFYCNAISFMASIALIILLQGDKMYQPAAGIRFYALYACMLLGMLALMGAYAAGTARRVRTSIYDFILVGAVIGFIGVLLALFLHIQLMDQQEEDQQQQEDHHYQQDQPHGFVATTTPTTTGDASRDCHTSTRKYVMLLAMLAASVTYQAGLDPPGGVWPDGYAAGSPVLRDSNLRRYRIFFYSNSSSFMASIVVIILLLLPSEWLDIITCQQQQSPSDMPLLLMASNTVIALDLVGLLLAYAAGSSRTMDASLYIIVLVVAVVIYIVVHVRLPALDGIHGGQRSNTQAGVGGERHLNGANGGPHAQDAPPPSQVS